MIYVHVPFCRSFCTYCDFYSELTHSCRTGAERPFAQWTEDVCTEIAARRAEIADTLAVNTLYIGGGTPSVLPKECLSRIDDTLGYGPYDEFTVEVNPEDLVEKGPGYVRSLLEFGVNRISMGVQSLDDGILRWMNRRHDAARAREAFRMLPAGISRSVDLITGVPGMTDEMLQHTVDEVVSWRPEHVSAYQLSIEEGSALAGMIADGRVKEASEEQCRRQYELLCRTLSAAGYHHYEISNWALPGHEAVHNSAYWTRRPYVGLGPGAHSLRICPDGRQVRSWNSRSTSAWTVEGSEILTPEEIREEEIMLLSRTDRGPIPERDWFVADDIISGMI